jgi:hypothetical protein
MIPSWAIPVIVVARVERRDRVLFSAPCVCNKYSDE